MSFKVTKLTGNNIATNDNNGILNGSHSFVKKISFSINGREVYDCKEANQCVNIKTLIDYSPSYAKTVATKEFYFLDTSTSPNTAKYLTRQVEHARNNQNTGWTPIIFIENVNPDFNKGFASRKDLLGNSRVANVSIPLNRYSLFEACANTMLPDSNFKIVSVYQTGGRLVIKPTRKQIEGGFLGTLASIAISMAISLVSKMFGSGLPAGAGLQVDNAPSSNTKNVYVPAPPSTHGEGYYPSGYPHHPPPFFGTWENQMRTPIGMGVKKKKGPKEKDCY